MKAACSPHVTDDRCVTIPAIGVEVRVRTPSNFTGQGLELIETVNAPGFGPPLHKHHEAEIFYVLEGRYLFEVDGERIEVKKGETTVAKGNVPHRFVNIDDHPSKLLVMIMPGFDALAFFTQLGSAMKAGKPDAQAMQAFSARWGVDFLGPPLEVQP
ncbi:MAG TPA: cupin domain-containing protein [Paraburkholderia sp.]|jgi:quercetin dioxygenase-like cupin family protein|nr:cupin domain-containing protein [Paraburkholderia sp.]